MTIGGFHIKNFCDCTESELEAVLSWRNEPEVRRNSFSGELISREKHFAYVKKLPEMKDRVYFLVSDAAGPVGVVSFTSINGVSAKVGYYKSGAKKNEKGIGRTLLMLAEKIARVIGRGTWGALVTEVFSCNLPSVKSIERAGYKENPKKKRRLARGAETFTVLSYELNLKGD